MILSKGKHKRKKEAALRDVDPLPRWVAFVSRGPIMPEERGCKGKRCSLKGCNNNVVKGVVCITHGAS